MSNKSSSNLSLPPDYHIHTRLCKHAEGEASDFHKTALAMGLGEICFTDHAPNPDGFDPGNRMGLDQFAEYEAMVRELPGNGTIEALFGVEIDYYDGCERFLKDWLERNSFDLVIGSVHYLDNWAFDNLNESSLWDSVDVTEAWRAYFARIRKLAEKGIADVVGHLDLPKKFGHRPAEKDLKEMAAQALDSIAAAGMAVEINTSGLRKPVKEIYPSPTLLKMMRERGIPICFGSDSHEPNQLGWRFDLGIEAAVSAGYTSAVRFRKRGKLPYGLPGPTS